MTSKPFHTVGVLGAGKLGTVLAQLSLRAGYNVYISGSGSVDKIKLSMNVLAPGAMPSTNQEVIKNSDLVILALPLSKHTNIPRDALDGKIVVDAMNYWWEIDGDRDDLRHPASSTSELVQAYFEGARIVKALSHMGYHHLHDEAAAQSSIHRKAIAVAGDDKRAVQMVSDFINTIGFDPLYIGTLTQGKQLEPGKPAFGANESLQKLKSTLS